MNLARSIFCLALAMAATLIRAEDKTLPNLATLKDKISIVLGDKIAVQFQREGDVLSQPTVVKTSDAKPPASLMTCSFTKEEQILMLNTKNPFTKVLHFRALARLKGRANYFETSIVPVRPGLFSIESWSDPIEDLILFDFMLSDDKK